MTNNNSYIYRAKLLWLLLVMLVVLFPGTDAVLAEATKLTLLYSSNVKGVLSPCG